MKMLLLLGALLATLMAQASEWSVTDESFISAEGLFDSGLTGGEVSDYKDPYAEGNSGNPFLKAPEASPYLQSVPLDKTAELFQNYYSKPDESGALKYYLKNAQ